MAEGAGLLDEDLDRLVRALDLERKVRLLTGATGWRTHGEPAVGLRPIVMSDGPVGVRGEAWDERDTALVLPSATAIAATWDEELVCRLGRLLAAEARRKSVDVLLAPTLNLHRSPLGGRHFECYSEDPLLTARIGAAMVRGIQAGGVAAAVKHYVANDSETERLTVDVRVDERTLREVYLVPFAAAVDAGAWVVMSAYNAVNGTTMSANPLLAEPLKGEWGFDGMVVSDWGAVRDGEPAALAAQDLAMPGPSDVWGDALVDAVRAGRVPEVAIDHKVRRLLRLAARVGALDAVPPAVATPIPADGTTGEAARLLRIAVAASTVLLRNVGQVLPLRPQRLRTVAVLGPNAAAPRIQGGGSAEVYPERVVSPLDGLRVALDGIAEVRHAAGVRLDRRPTPVDAGNAVDPRTGEPGVLVRLLDADGAELHAEHRPSGRVLECASVPGAATVEISARVRSAAADAGDWRVAVAGYGRLTLDIDGRTVLDEVVDLGGGDPAVVHLSPPHRHVPVTLAAGEEVHLVARRTLARDIGVAAVLAADPPVPATAADELAAAVELARASDVAIVVVGTTDEVEREGVDRVDLDLPGRQDALVRAVAAANPATVVVVNSGGPVAMPWRDQVAAVLLTWFPGQEAGHGLADVLLGAAEPGGRLPTTWAAALADVPVLGVTPDRGVLRYTEGPHLGHRAWAGSDTPPAYWFGHGLGYTTWSYEAAWATWPQGAGRPALVEVRLRNTGERTGREVVQVYLSRPGSAVDRPARWLAGFAAVRAAPGETVCAEVEITSAALRHWSVEDRRWHTEPGAFTVLVGRSAGDTPLRAELVVPPAGPPTDSAPTAGRSMGGAPADGVLRP